MELRVQYFMWNALLAKHIRQQFRVLDGYCTYQYRLIRLMTLNNLVHSCAELRLNRLVDDIRHILTLVRLVRRNLNYFKRINALELFFLCLRRTCHTCKLTVHTEIVLERDCRKRHALVLNFQLFLRFNRLMQAIAVTTSCHHASCKFIDDNNFAVINHIVYVAAHNHMSTQRLLNMMVQRYILHVEQVLDTECLLRLRYTRFS